MLKVTAVHCEVISEPRRRQYREAIYATKKPLSVSTADLARPNHYAAVSTATVTTGQRQDEDSSTLSDDDCTPRVSRSNSRGHEVTPRLRHLPPVHVETPTSNSCHVRGRLRHGHDHSAAHRSRSLPPPQHGHQHIISPQQHNNNNNNLQSNNRTNKRAPITSYYLPDCSQYIVTTTNSYRDEESYV